MLNLKAIRINKGKRQADIAEYLHISRAAYTNIENGNRDPDTRTLLALADFYDVTLDELFGRAPSKPPASAEAETLTQDEQNLLADYRSLNEQGREYIRQTLYMAVSAPIYKKCDTVPDTKDA